ncbi:hypothetical protein [Rhodopila sp.]|jgi:hypothetical protein|uniref:hypothetical protein n=1 Tax=Rhodopila sp. TaxID=2480087 RepID=UPI002D0DE7F8|nr:hypothetical protein [Rhodopila sp.]HVZ09325.1 hypothetical protein [Rhodopila sp.]
MEELLGTGLLSLIVGTLNGGFVTLGARVSAAKDIRRRFSPALTPASIELKVWLDLGAIAAVVSDALLSE